MAGRGVRGCGYGYGYVHGGDGDEGEDARRDGESGPCKGGQPQFVGGGEDVGAEPKEEDRAEARPYCRLASSEKGAIVMHGGHVPKAARRKMESQNIMIRMVRGYCSAANTLRPLMRASACEQGREARARRTKKIESTGRLKGKRGPP